jgi:RimJ/RimL family protein N-acetyltransferase
MAFPELVTTDRLVLRRWRAPEHTPALAAVNAEPAAVRFLNGGVPYTADETAAQSERFAAHWLTHGFGLWAIEADGAVVGFTGVCHPGWFPAYAHEVEAGWRLHPRAWGRGFATEAAQAALAAAFAHLDLDRVLALIDEGNDASVAVATRVGMRLDHTVADPHGPGTLCVYARMRA